MAMDRKRLEAELRQAEQELAELDDRLAQRPQIELGEGSAGVDLWEMALARRKEVANRAKELRAAMEKETAGSYGRCERCGQFIVPERLEVLPETTLCASCARALSGEELHARA